MSQGVCEGCHSVISHFDLYQHPSKHGETSMISVSSVDDFSTPSSSLTLIFSKYVRNTLMYSFCERQGGNQILGVQADVFPTCAGKCQTDDVSHDSCYLSGCPFVFILNNSIIFIVLMSENLISFSDGFYWSRHLYVPLSYLNTYRHTRASSVRLRLCLCYALYYWF